MKFAEEFEIMMFEMLDTRIEYRPDKRDDTVVQRFSMYDRTYEIQADVFEYGRYRSVLHIGFKNVDKDTFDVTNDVGYPGGVYGAVLNWTIDFIDSYGSIGNIIIGAHSNEPDDMHRMKGRMYGKILKKFLKLRPDFIENRDLCDDIAINNRDKFNMDNYILMAVSRKTMKG
jgi:hypothetical protein